ncbi:MAG: response regulator transcription factor [Aquificae bacterium]|nr:response regulator transcription factor [Aquificota bacterium]
MKRIVLLEDDGDLSYLLRYNLEREGYGVECFSSVGEMMRGLEELEADLFLVDVMLPDGDGFRAVKYLKSHPRFAKKPVLFLTARGSEEDKLKGFELGADDYVTKPFSLKELLARIRAVLKRCEGEGGRVYQLKGVKIDGEARKVLVDGREVYLTPAEFEILWLLFENYGRTLSRESIVDHLWSLGKDSSERAVDVHIKHVRDKLGPYRDLIKTVRGVGYRLEG